MLEDADSDSDSQNTFPGKSIHTEISPLRCAPVEMTRGGVVVLAGIRYDVFTPFTEAHNRISNFDYPEATGLTGSTISEALKIANVKHSNYTPRQFQFAVKAQF